MTYVLQLIMVNLSPTRLASVDPSLSRKKVFGIIQNELIKTLSGRNGLTRYIYDRYIPLLPKHSSACPFLWQN